MDSSLIDGKGTESIRRVSADDAGVQQLDVGIFLFESHDFLEPFIFSFCVFVIHHLFAQIGNFLFEPIVFLFVFFGVDKDGKEKVEKSKEDVLIDMPIVVLVNKNSASSSEILAGALKDLNEATIVGTTTYGKGVIQQFLTLRDGSGLKVTVEEYYTPNRTKINGVGIEPNEKIELPETITNPLTVERKDDTQLQKAIELLKK